MSISHTRLRSITVILLLSLFLLGFSALADQGPDTGQIRCFNNETVIPCPNEGEPFYGQDAQYSGPDRSYSKLGYGGIELPESASTDNGWIMTRDNVTKLIWEIKTLDGSIHDKNNTYSWYDSDPTSNGGNAGTAGEGTDTEDFINALNNAAFGGYSDWRLPSVKELATLYHYDKRLPAVDTAWFPNAIWPGGYWSTNSAIDDPSHARTVGFQYGGLVGAYLKSAYWYYVRAVRGGPYLDGGSSFVDNNDGTVTDTETGLMWQKETAPGTYTWKQALAYTENLNLGDYADWRLPNINELFTLVDYSRFNPSIDMLLEQYTISTSWEASGYWSSTTALGDSISVFDNARYVYFYNGSVGGSINDNKYDSRNVRAVRGGQTLPAAEDGGDSGDPADGDNNPGGSETDPGDGETDPGGGDSGGGGGGCYIKTFLY